MNSRDYDAVALDFWAGLEKTRMDHIKMVDAVNTKIANAKRELAEMEKFRDLLKKNQALSEMVDEARRLKLM